MIIPHHETFRTTIQPPYSKVESYNDTPEPFECVSRSAGRPSKFTIENGYYVTIPYHKKSIKTALTQEGRLADHALPPRSGPPWGG